MLVASNLPPNPVSKIRKSDFDCLNNIKLQLLLFQRKLLVYYYLFFLQILEFRKVSLCLLPYYLELFFH